MDYIELLVDNTTSDDEIIRAFYLHPMTRKQKNKYDEKAQEIAADRLFSILMSTSTDHILDIIEQYKEEIQIINTGNIPQFSRLEDADSVPDIVISNPNCKYKLIGYFFNKNAADYSNQKYGENHYKLAAQLGICEYADKKDPQGGTAVSFLGKIYKDLPLEKRDALRPKLCLQVPFIQHILVEARHGEIDAMDELLSILTKNTAIRRRSSLQQMMRVIEKTLSEEDDYLKNIKWGYKNED